MSRKIIIPKGLVDSPDQNNVIEISSRLSQSKGNLIAKRQGKRLVAQQLPVWQDALATSQESRNTQSNLVAVQGGCSKGNNDNTTPTTSRRNETFYSARSNEQPTTFYSQNNTGATSYGSALSGDITSRTCYDSVLERIPSRAHLNITGDDLAVESTIESNIQMTDAMMANILGDTRRNMSAQPKSKKPCPSNDSSDDYVLAPPRRLPRRRPVADDITYPGPNAPPTPDVSYGGFQPPQFSSPGGRSAAAVCPGNETVARPAPANQTFPTGDQRPRRSAGAPSPQTLPRATQRRRRPRPGEDTYPRSANRSLMEADDIHLPCSPPRDFPTDDSYDFRFQPWQASTMRSLSDMEDSSGTPWLYEENATPGKYNVIKPMTPSPSKSAAGGCGGACPGAAANQTMPRPAPAVNQTVARPRAANQTMARPANQTMPRPGSAGCPAGPQGSTRRPITPQTLPRASRRSRRPRPGEDTFPRSANRSLMDDGGSPCQPSSPPRDFPSDDSYDFRFQPWQASTMRSLSDMEDSSGTPWLYEENATPGKYNVIKPMTPSPSKSAAGGCGGACPGAAANQTMPRSAPAVNQTVARPRAANQTMARPANQTMARPGSAGCPAGPQGSPRRPITPQTLPRASRRSRRPRPGEDTFPRSANRSVIDDGGSPCQPSSPPRDFPSDDSYDFRFQPWQASTMRSLSDMEDSSGTPWLYEENATPGKYNVIQPMTPSPPRDAGGECAPCAQGSSGARVNQTMTRPVNVTGPASPRGSPRRPITPQTLPRASRRSRRPRPGEDTFPRSANRSLMDDEDSPCQPCSPPRDFPSDDSYDFRFQPWQASTMRSLSDMEDSSGTPWLYEENATPGKYNVIQPMTPSPPRNASDGCRATCSRSPANQTSSRSPSPRSPPANLTRSGSGSSTCSGARTPSPRPFPNLTMATYGSSPGGRPELGETFAGGCPGQSPLGETFARTPSPRPFPNLTMATYGSSPGGRPELGETFAGGCPGQSPLGQTFARTPSPRPFPNLTMATYGSSPGGRPELGETFAGGCPGQSPLGQTFARTPSPRPVPNLTMATYGSSPGGRPELGETFAGGCPGQSPLGQTFARTPSPRPFPNLTMATYGSSPGGRPELGETFEGGCPGQSPQGQTFARTPSPRPFPNLTMATYGSSPGARQPPGGETFAGSCPGAQTFAGEAADRTSAASRKLQKSHQTLPRASRRARRARPGHDTFPRSANRSELEEDDESSCAQYSDGIRDFPTDESYEKFEPLMSGTMGSFSMEDDSSEEPLFGFGAPLRRSQEGKYNIITPMTPSPKKDGVDECACAHEGGEQVVSYESKVVEDYYEEQ